MSESSSRESQDSSDFGGEDNESDEPSLSVGFEGESSQSEHVVEVLIKSRMVGLEGERREPSVDSREAKYREMRRNCTVLEAVADRVLALPHTPEVGLSNQPGLSGSVDVAVALASVWDGSTGGCPSTEEE